MWKIFVVISLLGCGGKPKDWTGKKLVTETVTVDGVTFTIDVPEGLPKGETAGDWDDVRVDFDYVPKVYTSIEAADSMPKDEMGAMRMDAVRIDDTHYVRKEKRPDGWALTDVSPDKSAIRAWSIKKVGDKLVECSAYQRNDGELPSHEKTKAMLEAICDSVKPR
jgi:hypothetical protein